ncbi:SLBB domain-containing protein [bacterium]|nr:SLBB domain-containing protein [bacterium]
MESIIDPDQYYVGPGDQFVISIWGQVNESFPCFVSPEGMIVIPSVKEIDVRNLTLSQAKAKMKTEITKVYVNTDVSINLLAIRTFKVNITGLTRLNQSVIVSSVDRVSEAIRQAGGFADSLKSSQRNIQLRRKDGSIVRADLIRRNNTGNVSCDPSLSNGDVIFVPPVMAWVGVYGGVHIPDVYEYVRGERISDLIELSGGLEFGADSSEVELVRFKNDTGRTTVSYVLSLKDIMHGDTTKDMRILPDDRIFIKKQSMFHPKAVMTVMGEVIHPGTYPIIEGKTRISEVIEAAGGYTQFASIGRMQLYRDKYTEGSDKEFERLKLTPIQDMNEIEKAYFKAKTRETFPTVQTDFRKLMANGKADPNYDILVKNNDSLYVPSIKKTVTIVGGALFPGILDWEPNKNYKYYIQKAGGYKEYAKRGDVKIIKALAQRWEDADNSDIIEDGDVIFIPERDPKDGWKVFLDTLSVVGQLAAITSTIILVYFTIKNN